MAELPQGAELPPAMLPAAPAQNGAEGGSSLRCAIDTAGGADLGWGLSGLDSILSRSRAT